MPFRAGALAESLIRRKTTERLLVAERSALLRAELPSALAAVRGRLPFGRVWLFGSLAWGGFGVRSDLDLAVEGLAEDAVIALSSELTRRLGVAVDLHRTEAIAAGLRDRIYSAGEPLDVP